MIIYKVNISFRQGIYIYGARTVILYFFSVVFKSFDLSNSESASHLEIHAFSALFVVFGLFVWSGAVALAKHLPKAIVKRSVLVKTFVLVIALLANNAFRSPVNDIVNIDNGAASVLVGGFNALDLTQNTKLVKITY